MVLAFQNKSSIMNMSMISTTNHFLANRFQCVSSKNTVRKIRQRMTVQLLLLLCMYGPIAAMGSCSIAPFGTAVITGDCVLSNQIIVIGTLNVTGIPDSQGNLPKIIGAGSNADFQMRKTDDNKEEDIKPINMPTGEELVRKIEEFGNKIIDF